VGPLLGLKPMESFVHVARLRLGRLPSVEGMVESASRAEAMDSIDSPMDAARDCLSEV
jgi:hypothetical protein